MASVHLNDAKIFLAGYDLSGQMNAVALEYAAEMKDATTFGATTRINAGGLKSVVASMEGLWDSSSTLAPDPVVFSRIGTADLPAIIAPVGTVGGTGYGLQVTGAEYELGDEVGELLPISVTMEGSGGLPLVRGNLLHNASASGNVTGTAYQLGAVGSTAYLYGVLQVFSGTGSFIVKIQSASNEAFTSPTDRITFSTVATGTPVAAQWATRVAGAITDTWWRVVATNPNTRNFAVLAGIQ